MYLQRLEIHGFKSFAQKAVLEFFLPGGGKKGITAVVGPNGSGKSNVADAIRWVLGEQSMKILRGKKGEDVIFAGSDRRARLGLAEVSLTLNNEDNEAPIEMSEVQIARRFYRNSESEYLINGHTTRLQDIALLLARARFGQKTYTVIGQGMIDSILAVSAAERKEFFDEAAGVKEFQIKRHQAVTKLEATRENLQQAEGLLQEIEPRLRSLNRQVKRLSEREVVEKELRECQKQYYGRLWHDLNERLAEFRRQYHRQDEEYQKRKSEHEKILAEFSAIEKETPASQAFLELQKKYEDVLASRGQWQEKRLKCQSQIEMLKIQAAAPRPRPDGTPPLPQIIAELESWQTEQDHLVESILKIKTLEELPVLQNKAQTLRDKTADLIDRLKKPCSQAGGAIISPSLLQAADEAEKELKKLAEKLNQVNRAMQDLNQEEKKKKGRIFELQRDLQAKQQEVHLLEQKLNNIQIELAKIETRQETLESEINLEMGLLAAEVKLKPAAEALKIAPEEIQPQIFRLKHQLELIGGIDPEAVAEHKETKERYDFLSSQTADLNKALEDTASAILELDAIMKERRDESLKKINEEFGRFFKILFNGGQAKLAPIYQEEEEENPEDEYEDNPEIKDLKDIKDIKKIDKGEPILAGIDIQATPPGKRIKDISILSGGERALTSVALICAILSHSPSPFVVLDEVDAALDEANSLRFAEIIEQLSQRTQFIVITHNRSTMAKAQVLYGVTMGEDGVSKLLSVKLEEAERLID